MIFVNEVMKVESRPRSILEPFILILSPFAPHVAEEILADHGTCRISRPRAMAFV